MTPIDQLVHFLMGTSQEEEPQRTFLCSACCAEKNPFLLFSLHVFTQQFSQEGYVYLISAYVDARYVHHFF